MYHNQWFITRSLYTTSHFWRRVDSPLQVSQREKMLVTQTDLSGYGWCGHTSFLVSVELGSVIVFDGRHTSHDQIFTFQGHVYLRKKKKCSPIEAGLCKYQASMLFTDARCVCGYVILFKVWMYIKVRCLGLSLMLASACKQPQWNRPLCSPDAETPDFIVP